MDNEVLIHQLSLQASKKAMYRNQESSLTFPISKTNLRERNVVDLNTLYLIHDYRIYHFEEVTKKLTHPILNKFTVQAASH